MCGGGETRELCSTYAKHLPQHGLWWTITRTDSLHVFEVLFGKIGPLSGDSDEFLRAKRHGLFVEREKAEDLPDKNDLTYTDPRHEKRADHHDARLQSGYS